MKNNINILGNEQTFPYIIEYEKNKESNNSHNSIAGNNVKWLNINDIIRLFIISNNTDIYYRDNNDWYNVYTEDFINTYIPQIVKTSNIKVYIPTHSISTYIKSFKYVVTANTWINGIKIDLGSFIFNPTDTYAISTGVIKNGNNEYYECIDFNIVDPYYLMYSDDWKDFRNSICNEPLEINNTGSSLQISLFVIDEYENRYMIKDNWIGGVTSIPIVYSGDYLNLKLNNSIDPLGYNLCLTFNKEYNNILNYLQETYNINKIKLIYDFVIKNKDSIIIGPSFRFRYNTTDKDYGFYNQLIKWNKMIENESFNLFFSDWNNFEEGWNIVASLTIIKDDEEILSVVSNELPITQEIFSQYINGGAEKIIDINDMQITKYNVVNKIENNTIVIDRPNESKTNIIQPVFFKVKELEILTLHPAVTENISINLDDYKSKVNKFTLLIADCKFNQIGSNSYGIIFKITANTLPETANSGTYYILDDNMELVTTGKYTCIR